MERDLAAHAFAHQRVRGVGVLVTVAAVLRAADSAHPPRRLVPGSDAWRLLTEALGTRLADVLGQRANVATADALPCTREAVEAGEP